MTEQQFNAPLPGGRCQTTFNDRRCTLEAGHGGPHQPETAPKTRSTPSASFARIIVTPIIVLIAGYLIAGLIPGVLVAAIISIAYILFASRRGS